MSVVHNDADEAAFGTVRCVVCHTREAAWVHSLDPDRARFRKYGKGHVWGSPLSVCDQCERWLRAGDVEALVAADPDSGGLRVTDLDERVRNGFRALVDADLGGTPIDSLRPAGYRGLVDEGFTPLESITGALFLADAWPQSDRRALPATNPEEAQRLPEGKHWFVRSPWPPIALRDVFGLVTRALDESIDAMTPRYDEEQVKAHVRKLLASREEDIRHRLGK